MNYLFIRDDDDDEDEESESGVCVCVCVRVYDDSDKFPTLRTARDRRTD